MSFLTTLAAAFKGGGGGSHVPLSPFCGRAKVARAESLAALYEAGRAGLLGARDQFCEMMAGGASQGPGRSPTGRTRWVGAHRADAQTSECAAAGAGF